MAIAIVVGSAVTADQTRLWNVRHMPAWISMLRDRRNAYVSAPRCCLATWDA